MKPRFYSRIMMLFAALPLVTACEKDDTPAIDKPDDKTQLATIPGNAVAAQMPWEKDRQIQITHF